MDKNEDEVEEHFEWLAEHATEWELQEPTRSRPKSINQLKSEDDVSDKFEQLAGKFHELESRVKGERAKLPIEGCRACGMLGNHEDAYLNAQVLVCQEQNSVEVQAINAPPQGYGGFYNPNTRWSHPGFSYKNKSASQNQNPFPRQPYQGNQFHGNQYQRYPNPSHQ